MNEAHIKPKTLVISWSPCTCIDFDAPRSFELLQVFFGSCLNTQLKHSIWTSTFGLLSSKPYMLIGSTMNFGVISYLWMHAISC